MIINSRFREESRTASLNGPGPWLVYALTEMLYCTHSWSLFSTTWFEVPLVFTYMVPSCSLPKGHEYLTSYAMIIPLIALFGSRSQLTLIDVGAFVIATTLPGVPMGTGEKNVLTNIKVAKNAFYLVGYLLY